MKYKGPVGSIARRDEIIRELAKCLGAILNITCGDCTGDKPGNCPADPVACALSAQSRAAVAEAKEML